MGDLTDRNLAATILESLLPLMQNSHTEDDSKIKIENLVFICRNLELEQLGILILGQIL